ncbi:MAG: DNA cytosine methyltransferase, partial [Flammeovirgaceae bacterium]
MKLTEQISIDEFDGKRFRTRLVEPIENSKALVTHYLHNIHNGVSKHYRKDALKVVKEYVNYKLDEENLPLVAEEALQQFLFEVENVPFPTPANYTFKFIDLFAGIGGFRLALQSLGGKCVFTSEWDKEAQKTYRANFGEVPFGDITKEQVKNYIPNNFDLLCAGFPCQAFSIAGRRGGFDDTRGTLFFDVAEIIKRKKPRAIFLENVKGLRNHGKGKTLETILNVLRNDLNYFVPEPEIINAKDFGVPQNRERIFIVAWYKDAVNKTDFKFPFGLTEDNKVIFEKEKRDEKA